MKIKELINFLEKKYPTENQEEWDKSGFSIKFNIGRKLSGVVVALDLTKEVLQKALKTNSNLIITHHPFVFENDINFEIEKYQHKKYIYEEIKNNNITVFSLHTNYDIDKHGTSYQLVKKIKLDGSKFKNDGYPCLVSLKTTPNKIIKNIKENLMLENLRTNLKEDKFNKEVKKIAFFSGSGDLTEILNKVKIGYNLIITSDIKWSDWLVYNENNIGVIEIPHLCEQVFVEDIYYRLIEKFGDLNINFVLLKEQYKNI